MGIERRRNGNLYYYRKRRVGSLVVSEYVGAGEIASLAHYRAEKERRQRAQERERIRLAQMTEAELDAELDRVCQLTDSLMEAELLAAGYHKHKRQWRKRRDGRN